ncbi:MAG: hypothetical protein IK007_08840 [Lachnospiraceae bacterium]|nr:hypothetical protein [Lachnospiraceae bacterium]
MKRKNRKSFAQRSKKAQRNLKVGINRNHKDRLFIKLFGSPENRGNMLSLYNALNGTAYEDAEALELYTLEDVIYLGMKNDVGYLLDSYMVLYEQQSTYNPNMPLRGLFYHAKMYEKYIKQKEYNLYSTTLKKIPTPQFYVFYNGDKETEDRVELKLSDAFVRPVAAGEFEWTAIMLNINKGHNTELLHKCETLNGYSLFIDKIKEGIKFGLDIESAVDEAVDWAIHNGVLSEYLSLHKNEVVGMILTEYDEKKVMENLKKESYEEGRFDTLTSLVKDGLLSLSDAAKWAELSTDEFRLKAGLS